MSTIVSKSWGFSLAVLSVLGVVQAVSVAVPGRVLAQCVTDADCSAFADQCNDAACVEPAGTCIATPKIDGFGCDDGDRCTPNDACVGGVCIGSGGGDADGDGYCDIEEIQALCNPDDAQEIPPQPNVYSGGRRNSPGEVLLAFHAPNDRDVTLATSASCATAGVCGAVTRFCTGGKIGDPCHADGDCNQPTHTCRIIVNYAGVPDLLLREVSLKLRRQPRQDLTTGFLPATPGCSRKVDLALPAGFKRGTLRLKASGTTGARFRTDRDRIMYRE
jgi:hypothetical protein